MKHCETRRQVLHHFGAIFHAKKYPDTPCPFFKFLSKHLSCEKSGKTDLPACPPITGLNKCAKKELISTVATIERMKKCRLFPLAPPHVYGIHRRASRFEDKLVGSDHIQRSDASLISIESAEGTEKHISMISACLDKSKLDPSEMYNFQNTIDYAIRLNILQ